MKRTFVLGDIHGAYKALLQVLERSSFDYENDTLIALGDICDGWSEVPECVEELLKIKNLKTILGNHDQWFLDYSFKRLHPDGIKHWQKHGGMATLIAYEKRKPELLKKHIAFFEKAVNYYTDEKLRCFVHAGIPNRDKALDDQVDYCWDHSFYKNAIVWHRQNHNVKIPLSLSDLRMVEEWYVGHVPVCNFKHNEKTTTPLKFANINFIDTGAAFDGCLTIFNIDTGEYFQSDIVRQLYADETGRNIISYNQEQEMKKPTELW